MSGVRPEKIGLQHQPKRPGGGVSPLVELPSGFPLLPSPGQLSMGRNPGRMGSLGERERTNDPFLQDLSGPMGPTPVLERGCGRLRDQIGMRLPSRQDGRRLWSCAPLSRGRDTDRDRQDHRSSIWREIREGRCFDLFSPVFGLVPKIANTHIAFRSTSEPLAKLRGFVVYRFFLIHCESEFPRKRAFFP